MTFSERGGLLHPVTVAQLWPPVPSGDTDERFTLSDTDRWGRRVANVTMWDMDVAACEESHLAPMWYSKEQDGLLQPWCGRVWCNPPFSNAWAWVEKAWREFACGHAQVICLLMPANRQEQSGWQDLVEPYRDGRDPQSKLTTHYPRGRPRFGSPGDRNGDAAGSPPFGCVGLVWGRENGT